MNLATYCVHCGELCDHTIKSNNLVFCCNGCRVVYDVLEKSPLKQHFAKTAEENKSYSLLKSERKYAFLDNEEIASFLVAYQNEDISVIHFSLPNIHCNSCVYLLENLHTLFEYILKVEVNFNRRKGTITYKKSIGLKKIAILLSQLGYPPDITLADIDNTKSVLKKSNLNQKIAISGFCFGNSMLMNMPDYLDSNLLLTNDFKLLFGWINLALALPVLLYTASDFFIKTIQGIRFGQLNIDLPISLGILTLFARSFYETTAQIGPGYVDSLCGLVFFLLIGKWYQNKTYDALSFDNKYSSYFPVSVSCLSKENDKEYIKPIRDISVGDKIVIHNDELIPVDGLLIKGNAQIDYSFVTGESMPESKGVGCKLYAGGRQKGGIIIMEAEKAINNSEFIGLWNSTAFVESKKTLQNAVDNISKYFIGTILLVALCTGVYWSFYDSTAIWSSVSSVLIVACPCALALVIPFSYGHASRQFSQYGLFLKNTQVIELLARIETVIFDKTGTLTSNISNTRYQGKKLTDLEISLFKTAFSNSSHPLSRIIYNHLPDCEKKEIQSFKETLGKGITCVIADHNLKIGSKHFVDLAPTMDPTDNKTSVHLMIDKEYLGRYTIEANYRSGIFKMLKNLRRRYTTHLLSGDSDAERKVFDPYFESLNFQQQPADKLRFISKGADKKLMIGDGLNDAGALKKATVGLAISDDIHQFSPACDGILSSKEVYKMPVFLNLCKKTLALVYFSFSLSFIYNIVGLCFAVSNQLTPIISAILMPISSVSVVGFIVLMINFFSKELKH